jgi:cytochrome P450
MPYTEAVLMEIMRISNVTPLTVPHCAMNDTQLQGFTIPKVKISKIKNIH